MVLQDDSDDGGLAKVERQIEAICLSFEQAWQRGERPRLEEFLTDCPTHRAKLFAHLLTIEINASSKCGFVPTVSEYAARFPEFASIVELAFVEETKSYSAPDAVDPGSTKNDHASSQIGRYQVLERLGKGGQAEVFRVVHPKLKTELVLKRLLKGREADSKRRQRLQTEGRLLARIEHPHLARVFDLDSDREGRPFVVMEYIRGRNLRQQMSQEPLSIRDSIQVVASIARAMDVVHRLGITHCDIKPENIVLDVSGTPKLIDFGLARLQDAWSVDDRDKRQVAGTIPFMPPEQARGETADARSDVFGLGAVAYWLLSRQTPYSGSNSAEMLENARGGTVNANALESRDVDKRLATIVMKAIRSEPDQRYSSAAELAEDLDRYLRRPHRHLSMLAVLALVLLAIITVLAWPRTDDKSTALTLDDRSDPNRPAPSASRPESAKTIQPTLPAVEVPLRIASIDVRHFRNTPEEDVPKGMLGRQSFNPVLGDRVQIEAKLSKPAYAYLIAFRPDGQYEVCFPESEDAPPPLTDTPRYPVTNRTRSYGLREGSGLWAFAIVASEQPLSAFRTWMQQRFEKGPTWEPISKMEPGIVWWDDGLTKIDYFTAAGVAPTLRSKDELLRGPPAIIKRLTDSLRIKGQVDAASAIGFCVSPKGDNAGTKRETGQ